LLCLSTLLLNQLRCEIGTCFNVFHVSFQCCLYKNNEHICIQIGWP
jgi:hypothetical protein